MVVGLVALSIILITLNERSTATTTTSRAASFYVVPLGTSGGLDESNLSSYLLSSVNDGQVNSSCITLDGGTIRHGVE